MSGKRRFALNRILVPPSPLPPSFSSPSTHQTPTFFHSTFNFGTIARSPRSPIVIPPTYHLSSPPHFEQMERQKGQRRSRGGGEERGWTRVRRVRGKRRRETAEKELQVTRPGASRWISNYSQRRFNTNRPCSTHLTCIKFPWNGRGDGNGERLGRAQINKSNKWIRSEGREEYFFFPLFLLFFFFSFFLQAPTPFLRIIISQRYATSTV